MVAVIAGILLGLFFPILGFNTEAEAFTKGSEGSSVPLVRAPDVEEDSFAAHASTHGRITLTQALQARHPSLELSQRLINLQERAQEAWLRESTDISQTLFRQIARLALEDDWRESQRLVIHTAMLRLAELSEPRGETEDTDDKTRWIQRAVAFDPEITPSPDLFDQKLREFFQEQRSALLSDKTERVSPKLIFPNHSVLQINGRRFEIADGTELSIPHGRHRITVLSNSHPAKTAILDANDIAQWSPKFRALVKGSCENPMDQGLNGLPFQVTDTLFSKGCVRTKALQGWIPSTSTTQGAFAETHDQEKLEDLRDIKRPLDLGQLHSLHSLQGRSPSSREGTEKKSLWRKPLFWIGVSAVVGGIIYAIHREQNRGQPTGAQPTTAPVAPVPPHSQETVYEPVKHHGF